MNRPCLSLIFVGPGVSRSADANGDTSRVTATAAATAHAINAKRRSLTPTTRPHGRGSGQTARPASAGTAARLLFDGALGQRGGLEPRVGDRIPAHHREPVGPGLQPRLGPLERRELVLVVLGAAGVELVLVEPLVGLVTGLDLVVGLLGLLLSEIRERALDALPLLGQQLARAFCIHG